LKSCDLRTILSPAVWPQSILHFLQDFLPCHWQTNANGLVSKYEKVNSKSRWQLPCMCWSRESSNTMILAKSANIRVKPIKLRVITIFVEYFVVMNKRWDVNSTESSPLVRIPLTNGLKKTLSTWILPKECIRTRYHLYSKRLDLSVCYPFIPQTSYSCELRISSPKGGSNIRSFSMFYAYRLPDCGERNEMNLTRWNTLSTLVPYYLSTYMKAWKRL